MLELVLGQTLLWLDKILNFQLSGISHAAVEDEACA